jgi:transcriptional regulator with XRE-family HTH domain
MIKKSPTIEPYAINLRRLMARLDMTIEQVVSASGLSERTVKQLLNGRTKPHARTLHRLAASLGISVDEFFWPPAEPKDTDAERRDGDILQKVDQLLASDRRGLLVELIAVLDRYPNGATNEQHLPTASGNATRSPRQ